MAEPTPYPELEAVEDRDIWDVQHAVARALYGDTEPPKHRFEVVPDDDGGFFIHFPDLPGCMTQAIDVYEVGYMAADAYAVWVESCEELGIEIPAASPMQPTALDTVGGVG